MQLPDYVTEKIRAAVVAVTAEELKGASMIVDTATPNGLGQVHMLICNAEVWQVVLPVLQRIGAQEVDADTLDDFLT